jgi:hypothetical protein
MSGAAAGTRRREIVAMAEPAQSATDAAPAARADIEALEAAAFRRLVAHLRAHPEVQNIDMMNLAGFCRNCLSNWLEEAARQTPVPLSRAEARTHVYGMSYEDWKARHQSDATPAQAAAFADRAKDHG